MKFKKLTKEQILISLDRLTRFKPTKEKYLRVFFDIILSNLLEPKFKRQDLEKMDVSEVRDLAEAIINGDENSTSDLLINNILKEYENSVFINDEDTQILLDNKINYSALTELIDEAQVVNLRWLKSLKGNQNLEQNRYRNKLKYPITKVLLVEGLTEEILLPAFSKFLGHDFYEEGIQIIPAGGKNQVVKLYYKLCEELRIPIFLLLDKDAEDNLRQIQPRLRKIDKIHLVSCGEFEDLLPMSLIVKTINSELYNFAKVSENDFDKEISNAKNLENIFKTKGLHEFKKADFAKNVRNQIKEPTDVSKEIENIINELYV